MATSTPTPTPTISSLPTVSQSNFPSIDDMIIDDPVRVLEQKSVILLPYQYWSIFLFSDFIKWGTKFVQFSAIRYVSKQQIVVSIWYGKVLIKPLF
jgi:hypothetical protein